MTLYALVGLSFSEWFYGVFSTEEKANQIKEELESKPWFKEGDKLLIEKLIVDEPRDAYRWMMEP